jgi:hypothetical protein
MVDLDEWVKVVTNKETILCENCYDSLRVRKGIRTGVRWYPWDKIEKEKESEGKSKIRKQILEEKEK